MVGTKGGGTLLIKRSSQETFLMRKRLCFKFTRDNGEPEEGLLLHVLCIAFTGAQSTFWVFPQQLNSKDYFAFLSVLLLELISGENNLTLLMIAMASKDRNLG